MVPIEAEDTRAVDFVASRLNAAIRRNEHTDIKAARAMLDSDPAVLEKLWQRVDDLWRHRAIDPELRASILRVAEQIDPALAEQLKHELDEFVPAVVLAAHEDELVPNTVALGAFPSPDRLAAPSIEDWLREDPRRLRGVVLEAARFCADDRLVVEGALSLAFKLEIDLSLAGDVVGHALIDARHERTVAK
jgi:hypothetical protein